MFAFKTTIWVLHCKIYRVYSMVLYRYFINIDIICQVTVGSMHHSLTLSRVNHFQNPPENQEIRHQKPLRKISWHDTSDVNKIYVFPESKPSLDDFEIKLMSVNSLLHTDFSLFFDSKFQMTYFEKNLRFWKINLICQICKIGLWYRFLSFELLYSIVWV